MRNRNLLRLAGVALLASASLLSFSTSANAWVGLSDKQKAHIEEYINCQILLLTDLAAFEAAQPPCGGNPGNSTASMATNSGATTHYQRPEKPECEYPSGKTSLVEGPYCPQPE